jgi:hypothetical protein
MNKSLIHTYFALALCLIISFHPARSEGVQAQEVQMQEVQAEGIAAIGVGGRDEARQAALKDALQQAALSVESQVMSREQLGTDNVPLQSLRVRPTYEATKYSILREWEGQGIYHVIVSAEVGKGKAVAAGCVAGAQAPKKKVAFVKFDVASSIQVDDIKNILDGLPTEFSSRLEASGEFISSYLHRSISSESEIQKSVDVKLVAEESGAQFVVSGRVVDAGARPSQSIFGSDKRNFDLEFFVYDGLTGGSVLSRHLVEHVSGDVMVGRDKPFGSRAFFETGFGKAVNRLMDVAVKDIRVALECLPFSAHIVRIEGKKVFLDAGSASQLRSGDKLVAYSMNARHRIVGLGGAVLGETESSVATVTLNQIYPQFSEGELPENAVKLGIKVGDIVRFEFAN